MGTKTKRALFAGILVAYASLSLWWAFTFPFSPMRLYSAIPSNAVFVSEHANLAERWKTLAQNPLVRGMLSPKSENRKPGQNMSVNEDAARWVEWLAGRLVLTAYVPAWEDTGQEAWIAASWLGGKGQLLKWGWFSPYLQDFETRDMGGVRGWVWSAQDDDDRQLSMAVTEGVLVACYSTDPDAAGTIIQRVIKGYPPCWAWPMRAEPQKEPVAQDRFWATWVLTDQNRKRRLMRARGAVTHWTAPSLAGWIRVNVPLPGPEIPGRNSRLMTDLVRLLGGAPMTLLLTSWDCLKTCDMWRDDLKEEGSPRDVVEMLDSVKENDAPLFAALLGGDMSTRMFKTVPSLIVGIQVREETDPTAVAAAALDKLNARHGWARIPRRVGLDGAPRGPDHVDDMIVVLGDTRGNQVEQLLFRAARDEPALAVRDGWLLFSSSDKALRTLLTRHGTFTGERTRWTPTEDSAPIEVAYAWSDLEATGTALSDALAAYQLVLISAGGRNVQEKRLFAQQLTEVAEWLKPLQSLSLRWTDEGPQSRIGFCFGQEAPCP